MIDGWGICCGVALRWMSLDHTDKSRLVQVMAWCHQATSHYLSQCWHRSMSPYGITRHHWIPVPGKGVIILKLVLWFKIGLCRVFVEQISFPTNCMAGSPQRIPTNCMAGSPQWNPFAQEWGSWRLFTTLWWRLPEFYDTAPESPTNNMIPII